MLGPIPATDDACVSFQCPQSYPLHTSSRETRLPLDIMFNGLENRKCINEYVENLGNTWEKHTKMFGIT